MVPYVWPQYHPNGGTNPLGCQFIDGAFWELQLDTLHERADGVVIWGAGADYPWDPTRESSAEDNWWKATERFLARIRG